MTAKPKIGPVRVNRVRISEEADGWKLCWNEKNCELHPTAAEAQRALQEHDRALADAGVSTINVLEWGATTRIGRMVIRALTGGKK